MNISKETISELLNYLNDDQLNTIYNVIKYQISKLHDNIEIVVLQHPTDKINNVLNDNVPIFQKSTFPKLSIPDIEYPPPKTPKKKSWKKQKYFD